MRGMKKFDLTKDKERDVCAIIKQLKLMVVYAPTVPRDTLDDNSSSMTNKIYVRFKTLEGYREIGGWTSSNWKKEDFVGRSMFQDTSMNTTRGPLLLFMG